MFQAVEDRDAVNKAIDDVIAKVAGESPKEAGPGLVTPLDKIRGLENGTIAVWATIIVFSLICYVLAIAQKDAALGGCFTVTSLVLLLGAALLIRLREKQVLELLSGDAPHQLHTPNRKARDYRSSRERETKALTVFFELLVAVLSAAIQAGSGMAMDSFHAVMVQILLCLLSLGITYLFASVVLTLKYRHSDSVLCLFNTEKDTSPNA